MMDCPSKLVLHLDKSLCLVDVPRGSGKEEVWLLLYKFYMT